MRRCKMKWKRKWRDIAKEWSTWALVLSAAIPTIQTIVLQINTSPGMEILIASSTWQIFSVIVAVLGIIVKNIPQDGVLKVKRDEEEK